MGSTTNNLQAFAQNGNLAKPTPSQPPSTPGPMSPRNDEIRRIAQARKIPRLVHFTQVDNVPGILTQGIVPVAGFCNIPADVRSKIGINDTERLDHQPNASSLSISFPNYKLFYKYRNEKKDAAWVVILLAPDILWELDCAFCVTNAADRRVSSVPLEQRRSASDFQKLFEDYEDQNRTVERSSLPIPDDFPTNPQAEVLVFGAIPSRYIRAICVQDGASVAGLQRLTGVEVRAESTYFNARDDYDYWQQQGVSGRGIVPHMAKRPIFIPKRVPPYVTEKEVDFQWFPGFSLQQKQRSIAALHAAAKEKLGNEKPILEISSRSPDREGVALSAFNLKVELPTLGKTISVENAFQGSKVFTGGGPYTDLYDVTPREAKRDERLQTSGELVRFQLGDDIWELNPVTAFYDWLYLKALQPALDKAKTLLNYQGFTDIEFNPKRSVNCQARSAALYVSLKACGRLEEALSSREQFVEIVPEGSTGRVNVRLPGI